MSLRAVARGSSPHARGAPHDRVSETLVCGIIPACAGSTTARSRPRRTPRDHPRMRGEHVASFTRRLLSGGSSPHARGARRSRSARMRSTRIIPACAGSTASAVTQRKWSLGSSPHARGAHAIWRSLCLCQGIIPACAGSTRPVSRSGRGSGDHPRMRGEHCDNAVTHSINWGSSPHARGAPERGRRESRCFGIIPACAGSTSAGPCRSCRPQDHPRMRGEHRMIPGTSLGEMGSSPHARGALAGHRRNPPAKGIIPACAGSTRLHAEAPVVEQDHPRMRGEH